MSGLGGQGMEGDSATGGGSGANLAAPGSGVLARVSVLNVYNILARTIHVSYGVTEVPTDVPKLYVARVFVIQGHNDEDLTPWSNIKQGKLAFSQFLSCPGAYEFNFPADVSDGSLVISDGEPMTVVLSRMFTDVGDARIGGTVSAVYDHLPDGAAERFARGVGRLQYGG